MWTRVLPSLGNYTGESWMVETKLGGTRSWGVVFSEWHFSLLKTVSAEIFSTCSHIMDCPDHTSEPLEDLVQSGLDDLAQKPNVSSSSI